MKHTFTQIIALATMAFMSASCIVKEMRDVCPCWVDLDFSRCFASDTCGNIRARLCEVNLYDAGGNLYDTRIFDCDTMADHYEVTVDRAGYICSALFYEDYAAYRHEEALIAATLNAQSDSLYGSSVPVDARGETVTVTFDAMKQFANVNVRFVNSPDSLWLELSGLTSSVETATLTAREDAGSLIRTLYTIANDGYSVNYRILRQWDDDITLRVSSAFSGNVLASVDLKSILEKSGYDFHAAWLRDIYIVIDFHRGLGTIMVEGWEHEYITEVSFSSLKTGSMP